MLREVRARVSQGKLEPMEDLGLPEGEEVTILVKARSRSSEDIKEMLKKRTGEPKGVEPDGFERAAGGWEGTLDFDEFLAELRTRRKMKRSRINLDQ